MKKVIIIFTVLTSTFLFSYAIAEVKVIVHPSNNSTLDQKAISNIFMGKSKSFPGAGTAVPINQGGSSAITNEFNTKVLKKNGAQLKAYWSKLVFTGKGTPPKEVDSEQEVVELIKSNPAIIGYVSANTNTDGVKIIGTF